MAESADAEDLKSSNRELLCGFKSRSRHQTFEPRTAVGQAGFVFSQKGSRAARRAARTPDSPPDALGYSMTNPHRRDDRGGVGRSRPHDGPQSRVWISTNRRLTVPNHTTIINLVRHRWTASSVLPWGFSRSLVRSRRQDGRCGTTRFLLIWIEKYVTRPQRSLRVLGCQSNSGW